MKHALSMNQLAGMTTVQLLDLEFVSERSDQNSERAANKNARHESWRETLNWSASSPKLTSRNSGVLHH